MSQTVLSQLEQKIRQLPTEEQRLLISRVAERLRKEIEDESDFEMLLAAMAEDKSIQAELKSNERDFSATEFDGLAG